MIHATFLCRLSGGEGRWWRDDCGCKYKLWLLILLRSIIRPLSESGLSPSFCLAVPYLINHCQHGASMKLKWAKLDHWTLALAEEFSSLQFQNSYWAALICIESARGWKVLQISLFMATNMTDISWGELILKFKLENFTFLIKIYLFRASNFSKMLHNPENPLIIKWNLFIFSSSLPNFNQRPSSRSRLEQDEHSL